MTKEYKWFMHGLISDLTDVVNEYAYYGWRLVNVIHDSRNYVAVLERDKDGREK